MEKLFNEVATVKGHWKYVITDTLTGKARTVEADNIITTAAKTAFAAQMSGQSTKDLGDNLYVAYGSSDTPVAVGDVALGTEVGRLAAQSKAFVAGVASIATFFAAGVATGTHKEFGLFGDGNTSTASAAAGSGILYSHVLPSPAITVGASETLLVTITITFS